MAIWKNARVTWNGQTISSSVRAAALELGANAPDSTTMGDDWSEVAAGGLKTAACELELNWAASTGATAVDALFGSSARLGQSATLTIRPTTAAISATNPEYSGSFVVTAYTPFQGRVGDQHIANVSLSLAGALSRAVST